MTVLWRTSAAGTKALYINMLVKFPDGSTKRYREVAKGASTKDEARDFERARYAEEMGKFKAGTLGKKPCPTFEEFTDRFLEIARKENKASWAGQKEGHWRRIILPHFGHRLLSSAGSDEIEDFAAAVGRTTTQFGKSPSASTTNMYLRILSRALHLAKELGHLPAGVPKIRLIRPGKVRPVTDNEFLTFDELDALLAAPNDEPLRTMLLVAARTGLRIGELLALRWDAVSFVTNRIHVRLRLYRGALDEPKGNRNREVPMGEDVLTALRARRSGVFQSPWVFPSIEDSTVPYGYDTARDVLGKLAPPHPKLKGWHVLRHTFAAHCFMSGVKPLTIQRWMGHSSLSVTTEIYGHLDPRVEAQEIALLTTHRPTVAAKEEER